MTIYYSGKTSGFYGTDTHGPLFINSANDATTLKAMQRNPLFPDDVIEISEEEQARLLAGQYSGKKIICVDGQLSLQEPPLPSHEELTDKAERRRAVLLREANNDMAPLLDIESIGGLTEEEASLLATWRIYRIALSRVPSQAGYPEKINWPEVPK